MSGRERAEKGPKTNVEMRHVTQPQSVRKAKKRGSGGSSDPCFFLDFRMPRSGPFGGRARFLHPGKGLRAREGIITWMLAEAFADWVPPDVSGDFDDLVGG